MIRALWCAIIMVSCSSVHAQIGYYRFIVTPSDARVFLNDQELRRTSDSVYTGAMVEGRYRLKVLKNGFNEFEKEILICTDELLEMRFGSNYAEVLKALPRRSDRGVLQEESGKFILLSDPPGQPAKIDTLAWDRTPVILVNYPAKEHRVTIGNVSRRINLPPYGIRRLRLKGGEMREVNWEIERPQRGSAKLEEVQIAFTKDDANVKNWKTAKLQKYPNGGLPDAIFKIDNDEWYLLCFLKFSNKSSDKVEFAQEFKICRDDGEISKFQSITRVAPREDNHLWFYHHLQTWTPGYYYLKINDEKGAMAIVFFSLHY